VSREKKEIFIPLFFKEKRGYNQRGEYEKGVMCDLRSRMWDKERIQEKVIITHSEQGGKLWFQ
jgi:hypothetical protein